MFKYKVYDLDDKFCVSRDGRKFIGQVYSNRKDAEKYAAVCNAWNFQIGLDTCKERFLDAGGTESEWLDEMA